MDNNIFADGMFWNDKHEKAPDFVNGSVSINVDKFVEWLKNQEKNEKGYVKIDLLTSREGDKKYFKLNTFKPSDQK